MNLHDACAFSLLRLQAPRARLRNRHLSRTSWVCKKREEGTNAVLYFLGSSFAGETQLSANTEDRSTPVRESKRSEQASANLLLVCPAGEILPHYDLALFFAPPSLRGTYIHTPRYTVPNAMTCLLDLPDEVLLSIAIKLALADLGSCLLACRRLSALISESALMQYLIRTMLHGLHDPLVSDMSIPERVTALDAWEKAWLEHTMSNEPFERHPLSAIGLNHAEKCIVQSGVLLGTQFKGFRLEKGYCYLDVLHLLNESKSVGRFSIPNLGSDISVQSYTYAPEDDLIAIISQFVSLPFPSQQSGTEYIDAVHRSDTRWGKPKVQFHQFSTSNRHPSAAKHCLEFDLVCNARDTCVECCGDNMVVILNAPNKNADPGDYIFLVEWKIGRITQARSAYISKQSS